MSQTLPSDAELDDLMAQLDEENARMLASEPSKPAKVAAVVPVPSAAPVATVTAPAARLPFVDEQPIFSEEELAPVIPLPSKPKLDPDADLAERLAAGKRAAKAALVKPSRAADGPFTKPPLNAKGEEIMTTGQMSMEVAQVVTGVALSLAVENKSLKTELGATHTVPVIADPCEEKASNNARMEVLAQKPPAPRLSHYIDPEKFKTDTAVREVDLDNCMMQQAGLRAHYGAQAAYAEAQEARVKMKFELLEAALYNKHKKLLVAAGEKATEKAIETTVMLDPAWAVGKGALIEAQTISNVNKALAMSLVDRRDMLIQLGSDRREEFKGQVRISGEKASFDSLGVRARAAGVAAIGG